MREQDRPSWYPGNPYRVFWLFATLWLITALPASALASSMTNDPNGFHGFTWGSSLADSPDLLLVETGERTQTYTLKNGSVRLGDAKIDSARFVMIDGKFARVAIRYRGEANHNAIMAYLQSQFGELDRIPGQMMRGLNQMGYWKGTDTQINLTYEAASERGYLFFESLTLAPRFNEGISETAY